MSEHWSEILLRILNKTSGFGAAMAAGGKQTPLQTAQRGQQQAGQTPTPSGTTPTPKSYGSKLATKIGKIGTGIAVGQQGDKLGAKISEGFKTELGRFRSDQAGIGGGPAKPPQQSEADQEMFQQQVGRRKGSGLTTQDRRRTAGAFQQKKTSIQSPRNVQNRQPVGQIKSFNPALASLMAVSAGFAASDAVLNAAGGRGARSITDDQLRLFETMANKKRGRRLRKEHSPLPPIQGLVWDEGAKRWRKPENVGKTASEVQGKKRIRGSALGQTAKQGPGGASAGKGRGREYSRGRAQRIASGDIGVAGIQGKLRGTKRRKKRKTKR